MTTLEIIKELCSKNGTSVSRLEKDMGYSNGSLSKVAKIPAERLMEIANRFGVSVEYLITGEMNEEQDGYYYNKETAQIAQEIFDNKELGLLMSASRGMKPEELKALTKFVQSMIQKEGGDTDS